MSEWTGPLEDWRIDWATYGGPYIRYPGWPHPENGHTIAKLHFADPTPFEEKRKRASLITAAPDMREALAEMCRQFTSGNPDQRDAISRARAALDKARGEV